MSRQLFRSFTHHRNASTFPRNFFRIGSKTIFNNGFLPLISFSKSLNPKAPNFGYSTMSSDRQLERPTIFALATYPGKAGVAVFRISGPKANQILLEMTSSPKTSHKTKTLPLPGKLILRNIVHPSTKEILDVGLVVRFQGPKSFTGEDIVELHLHGSPSVIRETIEALSEFKESGIRLAEPGEFTRRAFENEKLDLTAVEGLSDLLNAETSAQRRLALRHARGEAGQLYNDWRNKLISAQSQIEAIVDFGEEEEVDPDSLRLAQSSATCINDAIKKHLGDHRRGEILMGGIRLALLGPPNAGKSSLLNKLTRCNTAIVSAIPGTTRDIIEGKLDLGGMPLVVLDTAGIRSSPDDDIESEGIKRALAAANEADVRLVVIDGPKFLTGEVIPEMIWAPGPSTQLSFLVVNKCESLSPDDILSLRSSLPSELNTCFFVSCLTDQGIKEMIERLVLDLKLRYEPPHEEPAAITQSRHRIHLQETTNQLTRFLDGSGEKCDLVLAAEHLRLAATALGHITGHIDVEEVLDKLFMDFCIGK